MIATYVCNHILHKDSYHSELLTIPFPSVSLFPFLEAEGMHREKVWHLNEIPSLASKEML